MKPTSPLHEFLAASTEKDAISALTRLSWRGGSFSALASALLTGDLKMLQIALDRLRTESFEGWVVGCWHYLSRIPYEEKIALLTELADRAVRENQELWAALAYRRLYDLTPHLGKRALAEEALSKIRSPLPRTYLLATFAPLLRTSQLVNELLEGIDQVASTYTPTWSVAAGMWFETQAAGISTLALMGRTTALTDIFRGRLRFDLATLHPLAPHYWLASELAATATDHYKPFLDPYLPATAVVLQASTTWTLTNILPASQYVPLVSKALERVEYAAAALADRQEPGLVQLLSTYNAVLSALLTAARSSWQELPTALPDTLERVMTCVQRLYEERGLDAAAAIWSVHGGRLLSEHARTIPHYERRIALLRSSLSLLKRGLRAAEQLGLTDIVPYALKQYALAACDLAFLLRNEQEAAELLDLAGHFAARWRAEELRERFSESAALAIDEARARIRYALVLFWRDPAAIADAAAEFSRMLDRYERAPRTVKAGIAASAALAAATYAKLTDDIVWSERAFEYAQLAYRLWSAAGTYRRAAYATLLATIPALLHGEELGLDADRFLRAAEKEFLIGFRGRREWPFSELFTLLELLRTLPAMPANELRGAAARFSRFQIVIWPEIHDFLTALADLRDGRLARTLLREVCDRAPAVESILPYTCAQQAIALLKGEVDPSSTYLIPTYRILSPIIERA